MPVLTPASMSLFFHLLIFIALRAWAGRVLAHRSGAWWRRSLALPWLGLGFAAVAIAVRTAGLLRAVHAIEHAEGQQKGVLLAEAVNATALPAAILAVVAWATYAVAVAVLLFATFRVRRKRPDSMA